ncbi:gastrula zinc finger protein XlCGF57.1 isoform X2 [Toxorhynchites rutilus septentrionalis]|uniref:gastrula zinc finger protein XlCGF57.1 isoform X2 n=1 Tax=Toxorhynchites rutilus septentrionalis TaxID=329112 RepID=UPI00247A64A3|nr:gastrula zinc finger protein XlCGF57.1 isoform X2 [Toxorhynchites rutilus septentrionalis]
MAFVSNNLYQCSFCSNICNEEFHHVLVPPNQEQKLKTILQKLSSSTSQLSSYPTCDKCRQELITVHNISESCFQILPSVAEPADIKIEAELMIDDHELPDNGNIFERDSMVDHGPIEFEDKVHIKKESEEVFFRKEIDEEVDKTSINSVDRTESDLDALQKGVHSSSVRHKRKNESISAEKSFECEKCEKTFVTNYRLKVHIRTHTGERPYSCVHCSKAFVDATVLQQHIRTHSDERPYSCSDCPKAFKQLSTLRQHKRAHTDERSYFCPHCPKTYKRSSALHQHIRTHTGKRSTRNLDDSHKEFTDEGSTKDQIWENPYGCEKCEKSFVSKYRLRVHIRTHTGERPLSCPHCSKAFKDPTTLQQHIRTHTGERPYSCPHCPNAFKQASTLQQHIRTHTGDRPYPCSHCPRAFKNRKNLQQHIRTHTGELPLSCPHCSKAFLQHKSLKLHMRTHTGERPYACPHCPRTFANTTALHRHNRIHTKEKPHVSE